MTGHLTKAVEPTTKHHHVPVLGTTSARNSNVTRPTSFPPTSISKYTIGLLASAMAREEVRENARRLTAGVNAGERRAATNNVEASMITVVERVYFITRTQVVVVVVVSSMGPHNEELTELVLVDERRFVEKKICIGSLTFFFDCDVVDTLGYELSVSHQNLR